MRELSAGGLFGKNKIHEFEIEDLAKAREIVKTTWPGEGYLLTKDKTVYSFSKSFMSKLIEAAEDKLRDREEEQPVLQTNTETIPIENVENTTSVWEEKLICIMGELQNIGKTLERIPDKDNSNKDIFDKILEEVTEKNRILLDQINMTNVMLEQMQSSMSAIDQKLINMNTMVSNTTICEDHIGANNSEYCKTEEIENMDVRKLLNELYKTSCNINQMILETALRYIDMQ